MVKSQQKSKGANYVIYVGDLRLNNQILEGNSMILYRFTKLVSIQWVPRTNDQLFILRDSKLHLTNLPTSSNNNTLLTIDLNITATNISSTKDNHYFDLVYSNFDSIAKESFIFGLKLTKDPQKCKKSLFTVFSGEIRFLVTYQNDLMFADSMGNIFFVAMSCTYTETRSMRHQFITQIKDIVAMRAFNGTFIAISKHENGNFHVYDVIPDARRAVLRLIDPEIGGISDDLRWIITSKGVCDFLRISNEFLEEANFARAQELALRYQLLRKRERRLEKCLDSLLNDE